MRPWNEIYKGTTTLSKPWDVACDENAQVQSFGDRLFNVHGVLLSTETTGETTFNSYDAFARVAATARCIGEAALLPLQTFTYTPWGDLLATHTYTNETDIITETYAYDLLGNRIATTDALGNTTYRTYDPLGRVLAEWGATYPVRYTYDSQGRRTSLSTTRDGVTWDTTTWNYDHATGNCLSKTYADGSTVTYTYTPDNLLLRTTYASGKWKENVYDAQRRLCGVIYSSSDMDYELQLDDYGNATNVADAAGNSWRYEYGFHSKLLAEKYATSGGPRSVAATNNIVRAYDSFDRPTGYALSINDTSRCGIGYAYDDDGDLTHITATNSAGRVFSVAYTNNVGYNYGHTLTTPSGNTIRRIVERDDYRRSLVTNCVTYFNSSLIDSNVYAFDALSRPTARTTGTTGVSPVTFSFAYNDRSEVVSAAIGTNLFTHAYDDIGNHLLFGDNAVTYTFTHNQVNQMVGRAAPSAPPTSFTYTPDGGLSFNGTWSYAYDAEDQLLSVTSASLTNGAIRVLNTYDYRRRRISKTVQRLHSSITPPPSPPVGIHEWETQGTHTFVWDGNNIVLEKVEFANGTTRTFEYFWGADKSGTEQGAGGVEGLLAVSMDGVFYLPCYDPYGNIILYVSETGSIAAQYTYDPYGNIIESSGPLADVFSFGFSTKYHDRETGMVGYQQRVYLPDLGRWLNRDPIEEEGGVNLYGFCENRPHADLDSLGLAVKVIKNIPGRQPFGGWKWADSKGETYWIYPNYKVVAVPCGAQKIGFQVTIDPPMILVYVYFRTPNDYITAMSAEQQHIDAIIRYDQALTRYKAILESTCACPKKALEVFTLQEAILDQVFREVEDYHSKLDEPGGPHGHH